jgi:DNA-binding transcriptional LysR family regulator
MDLNEVLMFTRVVETKSFTAAADSLGVPKSTVSRKLAQLEERLGVRLVQRTTRKLSLTDVGQAYYDRCSRVIADIAAAEQVVNDMQATPRGLLRVTAAVDFADHCLSRIVADFVQRHSDINVELDANDRIVDLIEEGFDVAIRFGPLAESSLTAKRLCQIEMFLCASPQYLAEHGTPTKIADLEDHRRILFAPISRAQSWTLANGKERFEFGRPARLISNSFSAVREALIAHAGVGLCSDFLVSDDIAAGRLVQVLPKWATATGDCFAVYPSRRNMAPKLSTFLNHVTSSLRTTPWQSAAR